LKAVFYNRFEPLYWSTIVQTFTTNILRISITLAGRLKQTELCHIGLFVGSLMQGTLTEGEGSVPLTSLLSKLAHLAYKIKKIINSE